MRKLRLKEIPSFVCGLPVTWANKISGMLLPEPQEPSTQPKLTAHLLAPRPSLLQSPQPPVSHSPSHTLPLSQYLLCQEATSAFCSWPNRAQPLTAGRISHRHKSPWVQKLSCLGSRGLSVQHSPELSLENENNLRNSGVAHSSSRQR